LGQLKNKLMTDVLYYTVAFGDYDCKLAGMVVESLRSSGFTGDAVVFTDRDVALPQATTVNVTRLKQAELLQTSAHLYHVRNARGLDYLLMRMIPHHFLDLQRYQYLLFSDTDVLFFKNPHPGWMDPSSIFIQKDCLSLWQNVSLVGHLFPVDQTTTAGLPGYCAGIYCLPRKYFSILDEWRELYFRADPAQRQKISDQRFLNYLLWNKSYPVTLMPGVSTCAWRENATATHYWQNTHQSMMWDFITRCQPMPAAQSFGSQFSVGLGV